MPRAPADPRPVLWQLQLSHYNEKVRWALDHKRVAHRRRSLLPGVHRLVARRLGAATTPILQFDGWTIGDSSAILAAVEERWPTPALYPADPERRRRALALEEFFDEQLGPHIRRALYHDLLAHPHVVLPLFSHGHGPVARVALRGAFPALRIGMRRALEIDAEQAARSRAMTAAAVDRLEAELGSRDYLVGDAFGVADLTAAALLYPRAMPPQFPYPLADDLPPATREFLDGFAGRRATAWVAEMYQRHRTPRDVPAS